MIKMTTMTYKNTLFSCFFGIICQAIIVNFTPLLFLTFSKNYSIPMEEITLLISANFAVQLIVDVLAARYVNRIGYRKCFFAAHVLCALGLIGLTVLPEVLPPLLGLSISTVTFAIGGGLLEVMISPLVEACPTKNKSGVMSIMHSFYCWGVVFTVIVSTVFFAVFDINNWKILSLIWAALPAINAVYVLFIPLDMIEEEESEKHSSSGLLRTPLFWLMLLLMLCSGAAELSVAQWASAFAETALGVEKSVGDLLGACGFAFFMALSRTLYGKFSERLPLRPSLMISALLCIAAYLMIGLSPSSIIGLIGCMLCGFSVGVFWPGTLSLSAAKMPMAGTAMFAILAIAGDVGCTSGPAVVGAVSSLFGGDLKRGILSAVVFPIVLFVALLFLRTDEQKNKNV